MRGEERKERRAGRGEGSPPPPFQIPGSVTEMGIHIVGTEGCRRGGQK